jgi:hypothetical protein
MVRRMTTDFGTSSRAASVGENRRAPRSPLRAKLRRIQREQISSGLPSQTDIARHNRHVSRVPEADVLKTKPLGCVTYAAARLPTPAQPGP